MVQAQLGLRHQPLSDSMNLRAALAVLIVASLLATPVLGYTGKQLNRTAVEPFELTTQNGSSYDLAFESHPVVVVSFMFTRCTDVCPVITQLLKSVELELNEAEAADVQFLSITVDPTHDTPDQLAAYTALHGVDWPHLTGDRAALEPIWANFGVVVQESVIEAHVLGYQPEASSVTVVDADGNASTHMFAYNGWTATRLAADEAGWDLNVTDGAWGKFLHGINGMDSPSDWSWYWELNLWNASAMVWESAPVGMEEVNTLVETHLAWRPSTTNRSLIPAPNTDQASSVTVQWNNSTSETVAVEAFTGYHLTEGAMEGANRSITVESSSFGHYLTTIDNVTAPDDGSWWWNLHRWNATDQAWVSSDVGMDGVVEPDHLAWAPSTVNASDLPAPTQPTSEGACNGHGWEMGSGASMHCMCDDGYAWDGDDRLTCIPEVTEDYTVGHSTITYLLNARLQPVVAWTGDRWLAEDFTEDVRELLRKQGAGGYANDNTPWASLALSVGVVMMAATVSRSGDQVGERPGRKGE